MYAHDCILRPRHKAIATSSKSVSAQDCMTLVCIYMHDWLLASALMNGTVKAYLANATRTADREGVGHTAATVQASGGAFDACVVLTADQNHSVMISAEHLDDGGTHDCCGLGLKLSRRANMVTLFELHDVILQRLDALLTPSALRCFCRRVLKLCQGLDVVGTREAESVLGVRFELRPSIACQACMWGEC